MRRVKVFAATVATGAMLAVPALIPSATADPIYCPGNLTPTHAGGSNWYCANPHGGFTGAGWHTGTGEKIHPTR